MPEKSRVQEGPPHTLSLGELSGPVSPMGVNKMPSGIPGYKPMANGSFPQTYQVCLSLDCLTWSLQNTAHQQIWGESNSV